MVEAGGGCLRAGFMGAMSPPSNETWVVSGVPLPAAAPGADTLRLLRIASILSELGEDVVLMSAGGRDEEVSGLPHRPLHRPVAAGASRLTVPTLFWSALELARRVARERPRRVYLSRPDLGWALGARTFVWFDALGLASIEIDQKAGRPAALAIERRAWRILEARMLRRANRITTVNDAHVARMQQVYRMSSQPVVLRDAAVHAPPPEHPAPFVRPAGSTVVLFAGSLIKDRLSPILEAWPAVISAAPQMVLAVVGDGPDRPGAERRAGEQGWLDTSIFFLGHRSQLETLRLVEDCDIAYSDCWSELGFPAKVYEYLGAGRPIVCEAKPQISEVLTGGRDALLFDGSRQLARRLTALSQDASLRARLAEAARRTGHQHTWEIRARQIAAMLEQGSLG